MLEVAIKNADLLVKTFGLEPGQQITVPGHEEIEIGLVKLYRATGEEKYLRLAKFFRMSPDFWMNLQLRWDLYFARQTEKTELQVIRPYSSAVHA